MRAKGILKRTGLLLFYFLLWQFLSVAIGKEYLLPSPIAVLHRFFAIVVQKESWSIAAATLARVSAGYMGGVFLGILLGFATAASRFLETLLTPLRSIIRSTPVTSIILLAILFLTSGLVPIFISLLMVAPIVWTSTADAIKRVDRDLLEMGKTFGFGGNQMLKTVILPSVQPALLSACTTALGFAWKSGVAAEIISLPKTSVGYMLYVSKLTLEAEDLFAWTFLIVILSLLLEKWIAFLLGRIRRD